MHIIENHAYVKTLYDAWIPEFGSGMDPDPAYRIRPDSELLDPVRIRIRPDPETLDPVQIWIRPDPECLDPAGIRIRPDLKIVDPVHP